MPNHNHLTNPNKELGKFYQTVCLHLDDLELRPEDIINTQKNENLSSDKPLEEELYGKIMKDEFIKILNLYEKQQESQELQEKPVTCNGVVGGSYAKLLFSKTGFHHPGSTSYLVKHLQIRNVHRNSFLGGHSTFCPTSDEELAGLKKNHDKILIKQITDRALNYIDSNQLDLAKKEITAAYNMDERNGDVLATRGRYYSARKEYSTAVRFLKSALDHGPHNEHDVRMHLSDTLYFYGLASYRRRDFKDAKRLLTDALEYNPSNEGARLHKNLCEDELQKSTLFAQKPPMYRK